MILTMKQIELFGLPFKVESEFYAEKNVSNQKQPSCKKRSAALEKAMVKKDVKSKVAAKKWL